MWALWDESQLFVQSLAVSLLRNNRRRLCLAHMGAARKYNSETASLWEENLKRNIWA